MKSVSLIIGTIFVLLVMLALYIWFTPPDSAFEWLIYIIGLITIGIGSFKVVTDLF